MLEPRADMLPDPEPNSDVVNPPVADAPLQPAEPAPVPSKKEEPTTPPEPSSIPAGMVPYQALDEERIKRKEAERKLRELEAQQRSLETSEISDQELSEEGKVLQAEISVLKEKLNQRDQSDRMAVIVGKYPAIVDKMDEFEDYRATRPNLTIDEAAEVFATQQGLTGQKLARKGLEPPTGGEKTGTDQGFISAEDSERLRSTDYKKWEKLVRKGNIDPDKWNKKP